MSNPFRTSLMAATLSLIAGSALAQEVTLRFQHFVSPNSANPKYFIEPWAEKVEAESNGRIKVEIYPFMQLGGAAPEQFDLILDGVVDGGIFQRQRQVAHAPVGGDILKQAASVVLGRIEEADAAGTDVQQRTHKK